MSPGHRNVLVKDRNIKWKVKYKFLFDAVKKKAIVFVKDKNTLEMNI